LGRSALARWIACSTNPAAAVMFTLKSNWSVIDVVPSPLVEFIEARPGIAVNWSSSGVATVEAITVGLAPGSCAETTMVGNSTFGSAATGRSWKQTAPNTTRPAVISAVAIGRRMKVSEMFMGPRSRSPWVVRSRP
jgi:hypothetical protein